MRRILYYIILIQLLSCKIDSKPQKNDDSSTSEKSNEINELNNNIKYVIAKSGLNYRKKPKGEIIGKFKFGDEVEIVKNTDILETITDKNKQIKGEWLGVTTKKQSDIKYVFSGYLANKKVFETLRKKIIDVKNIDSLQFLLEKNKATYSKTEIIQLTNPNDVEKLLNGFIEFDKIDEETIVETPIKKIKFRNGKEITNKKGLLGDSNFVSYFPNEDIILLSNAAGGDESLNLKNGKNVQETGNPNLIKYSPKKTYRLNGYTNAQGTYFYFIQKKVNNEYEKKIPLSDEIERLKHHWIFHIAESFWVNENILYLKETDMGGGNLYFLIKIIE